MKTYLREGCFFFSFSLSRCLRQLPYIPKRKELVGPYAKNGMLNPRKNPFD